MDTAPPPPPPPPKTEQRKPNRHERRALAAIARSPEKSAKLKAALELQRAAARPAPPQAEETPPADT